MHQIKACIFFLLIISSPFNRTLSQDIKPSKIVLLEPEFMMGSIIPIYDSFPVSSPRKSFFLNFGILHTDTSKHWAKYYKFPTVGISLAYSDLGNRKILRKEFSIIPYIILKTSRDQRKSIDFKIGLGGSYFNNPFDPVRNPDNKIIGSDFTWTFQFFLYKKFHVTDWMNFKIGFGLQHSSNAHTTIPNYGMNSAMVSIATQFVTKKYNPEFALKYDNLKTEKNNHYFLQTRLGYGWHELGGTWGPVGGKDYPVNSYALSGGIIFKRHFKLSAGFTYRFYHSFYDFLLHNTSKIGLGDNPRSEASNWIVYTGLEFLIGHLGMDMEIGYNLYKPFYAEFNNRWDLNKGFEYWRNKYIATRLGLKLYLISNERMPRHNIYIGTHINANFGKADFMDMSLGYTFLIK